MLSLAREAGVQVHPFPKQEMKGRKGMYICHELDGPGIAIDATLPVKWMAWTIGHELGHHHSSEWELFSPFAEYSGPNAKGHRAPAERKADDWAVTHLISTETWAAAEDQHPCDLSRITADLGLPLVAGIVWERRRRKSPSYKLETPILLSEPTWALIHGNWTCSGGYQDPLLRILETRHDLTGRLSRKDFSLMRERVAKPIEDFAGGYRTKYQAVLDELRPQLEACGGVSRLWPATLDLIRTPPRTWTGSRPALLRRSS